MRIGVMGGTFDPIHIAHLIIAEEARIELGLSKVVFIPAGEPWMKSEREITPAGHRIAMIKLAIESNPYFTVSTIEIDREGPSYTVDTLEILREEIGVDAELFLVVGWDSLGTFKSWKDPERIIKLSRLVSFPRLGYDRPELDALEAAVEGIAERLIMMERPCIGISSSEIRSNLKRGKNARYLIPVEVGQYINENKLYCSTQ